MTTTVKVCRNCSAQVASDLTECPYDGSLLELPGTEPLVGTILGDKYEVLSVIGRGGMSTVYKARHQLMNRLVAIKLIKEHLVDNPTVLARFEREAQAMSALNHPNIVTVFDFGLTPKGEAFLVMDWVEGQTLDEIVVQQGHLEPFRAIEIFRQIASALTHAHRTNIIHRDLKPLNICLVRGIDGIETAKIVDFGLAKYIAGQPAERNLTKPGYICGSPLYMSPEQVQGKPLNHCSDIYSFGCLMYETLSSNPPFVGDTTYETMNKQVEESVPKFASCLKVPARLEAVVQKCLSKDPRNRYQSADELLLSLTRLSGSKRRTKKLFAVIITLVIVCIVALVIALSKR